MINYWKQQLMSLETHASYYILTHVSTGTITLLHISAHNRTQHNIGFGPRGVEEVWWKSEFRFGKYIDNI